ncbi:hypothetical protein SAMD00019534_073520 [Acytostelium subglobosum LB1]|uniref:hypothetical protein n=1 Tax=Acytostelium subglobosum LB1 TaxID=1410327 RepID=UPI000644DAB3|nr:hypothetical protein SAMD00019534_073520 [Acytostelium subglobosum LB1]GAM24177.1 hypothetical protein SAMD00019534_073520 [Acytostelium subglobosum LB1]|eukprot:XP_012753213.1 hypothetical protein SAMD00019534_073520 [Acytostelium subglobosum LB1]
MIKSPVLPGPTKYIEQPINVDNDQTPIPGTVRELHDFIQTEDNRRIPLEDRVVEDGECQVSCLFTDGHETELTSADMVLFDPSMMGEGNKWKHVPLSIPQRYKHQRFGLLNYHSSSQYGIIGNDKFRDILQDEFNQTLESPVQMTLACPPSHDMSINSTIQLLMQESDLITRPNNYVFLSSNCKNANAHSRTELMEHIRIDSAGDCLNNVAKSKVEFGDRDVFQRVKDNIEVMKKYKFVFTFENENSTDFVSEKVYSALYSGSIPVYMGASNIDDWVPTGSIIKASSFGSPSQLAIYLVDLLINPLKMRTFFEWKSKPIEQKVIDKLSKCVGGFKTKCELCKYAYSQLSQEAHDNKLNRFKNKLVHQPYELSMQGQGDHILVSQAKMFDLTYHYTLMAWVKPLTFGDQRLIDKGTNGALDGIDFDLQRTSKVRGELRLCAGGMCFHSTKSIPANVWTHVAVVYDVGNKELLDNKVVFYINGEPDGYTNHFEPTVINRWPLVIGSSFSFGQRTSGTYHGRMDNIAIFNRSLSDEEVKHLVWNDPQMDTDKSLLLYYDMDDYGDGHFDGNIIFDRSMHNNNGARVASASKLGESTFVKSYSKEIGFNKCF